MGEETKLIQQLLKADNKQEKLKIIKQLQIVIENSFELKRKQLNITEEEFNQVAEHLYKKMQSSVTQ